MTEGITQLKEHIFIFLRTIKTPHLASQYKERNHFKTEDPRVAQPAGKHVGSGVPSPTTLQHQLDTSVKHLPCRKLNPKDQTRGGTLSPGQDSNSSPLKTLGKLDPADRSCAASAVKGSGPAREGGPGVQLLLGKQEGKGAGWRWA